MTSYGLTPEQHRRVAASVRHTESQTSGQQTFQANQLGKVTRWIYVYEYDTTASQPNRYKARFAKFDNSVDPDDTNPDYDDTREFYAYECNTWPSGYDYARAGGQYYLAQRFEGKWIFDAKSPQAQLIYVHTHVAGASHTASPAYYSNGGGITNDPLRTLTAIEINGYSIAAQLSEVAGIYYIAQHIPYDDASATAVGFDSTKFWHDTYGHRVKITASDTTASYLDDAITEGDAIETEVLNPGADETLKINVLYQNSITLNANVLELDGDVLAPGNNYFYGTNGAGAKGFQDLDAYLDANLVAGDAMSITHLGTQFTFDVLYNKSIVLSVNKLELDGDEAAPGADQEYGTNGAGAKGWHNAHEVLVSAADTTHSTLNSAIAEGDAITTTILNPAADETLEIKVRFKNSLEIDALDLQLVNDVLAPGNSYYYGTNDVGTKGWHDLASVFDAALDAGEAINITQVAGVFTFDVLYQNSIVLDGVTNKLELDGDEAAPGEHHFYGTGDGVAKGWVDFIGYFDQVFDAGDGCELGSMVVGDGYVLDVLYQHSIELDTAGGQNHLQLKNDEASPGSYTFYGCDGSGIQEWNDFSQRTLITSIQVDASDNLQIKTTDAYVAFPQTESAWTTVTGWSTTEDCP